MSRTREIDPQEALRLRRAGHTWRKIGQVLAKRRGRPVPYTERAVMRAVRAAQ
jgi:hypothetical protein